MADTISLDTSSRFEDEELSDEQMHEMLAQAAARLSKAVATKSQRNEIIPKLDTGDVTKPYISTKGDVAQIDTQRLLREQDRKLSNGFRKVEDPVALKKKAEEQKKATAGQDWYHLPATDKNDAQLKRDYQLIHMRGVLDPKRFYKKTNGKLKMPDYAAVGTVVEGATEFYSARLANKDRKQTFADEVLASEKDTGRFKRKYGEIQSTKTSGKKAYYKALQAKRTKKG